MGVFLRTRRAEDIDRCWAAETGTADECVCAEVSGLLFAECFGVRREEMELLIRCAKRVQRGFKEGAQAQSFMLGQYGVQIGTD